jgi:hypothetical protein
MEIIALIEEMAVKNRTWRAPRIKVELLKLGIVVHADTVRKYMRRARKGLPPGNQGQTWATFIKDHAGEMWACDFLQTYDLFFRVVFVYFTVVSPKTRKNERKNQLHFNKGTRRSSPDQQVGLKRRVIAVTGQCHSNECRRKAFHNVVQVARLDCHLARGA